MTLDYIIAKSESLIKKHRTRDPFCLAKEMGIRLLMCSDFHKLKGMYRVILRNRFVFLNENLPEEEKKLVLAHELGHDALHREWAGKETLRDSVLMDFRFKPEYEANLFAANLLLSDEAVLEVLQDENSLDAAAAQLACPPALLALKLKILEQKGHSFREVPYNDRFLAEQ